MNRRFWIQLLLLFVSSSTTYSARAGTAVEKDPHRLPCAGESCNKIKRFLKSHYCGESPFGNGPDDGCDIRIAQQSHVLARVIADYNCDWNQQKQQAVCNQTGQLSTSISEALRRELHRLGLPPTNDMDIHYRVLSSENLSVAEASYDHSRDSDLWLCQVVVIFRNPAELHVLHEVPFQKTDVDVPEVTTWSPIDIADVNNDGRQEIVLEGDAYENHWFEVVTVNDALATKTVFSGLGYYL
jgi:hypothetical protein